MIDFRKPKIQHLLNNMEDTTDESTGISYVNRNFTYNMFSHVDYDFLGQRITTSKTISELNPFRLTPDVWKRVNQPDVLYFFEVDLDGFKISLDEFIKKFNIAIANWDRDYRHHFYEQLTGNTFIFGSKLGQEE